MHSLEALVLPILPVRIHRAHGSSRWINDAAAPGQASHVRGPAAGNITFSQKETGHRTGPVPDRLRSAKWAQGLYQGGQLILLEAI